MKLSPLTIRKDQNLYAVYKKQRDDQNSVYSINKFNCSGNLVMDTSKELEDSTLKALCHKIDEASILKALCEKIEYKNFDLAEIRNELSKISDRGREKWPLYYVLKLIYIYHFRLEKEGAKEKRYKSFFYLISINNPKKFKKVLFSQS